MMPDWLVPLAGFLLAFAYLVDHLPGAGPRGWVSVALASLAVAGFGAATVITLTNGV
jgi:hypothetical protein